METETGEIRKVIVAGCGKSGIASAGLLLRNGVAVLLYDGNTKLHAAELAGHFPADATLQVKLGDLTDAEMQAADLLVISPGIPVDSPVVLQAEKNGLPVWGEIELASRFCQGKIAAITGTNGKTTTTTLVGEILKNKSDDAITVGNIGIPFADYADKTDRNTLVAAEISSFQLETVHTFHPHVSAVLNLTPDHLNRHHTLDCYYNTKFRITENQTAEDFCVLNLDDPETAARAPERVKKPRKIWFSRISQPENGVFVKDGWITVQDGGKDISVVETKDIRIPGNHNLENVLAAVAVSYYMGVSPEIIAETVRNFQGVAHRIEFIRELRGVKYYNDSKGTNPDAAIKALQAMKSMTLLIAGGYDKKSPYDDWVDCFPGKVRYLVLLGETADDIQRCCKNHGFNQIVRVDSLEEAVNFCYTHAWPGDNVLLSPACASWDMFRNYEERGDLFRSYVNQLED